MTRIIEINCYKGVKRCIIKKIIGFVRKGE